MADNRVKDIVERFLRGVRWTRYLYACNNHNLHVVCPSYGSTTWTHVGNLYEIVRPFIMTTQECPADASTVLRQAKV